MVEDLARLVREIERVITAPYVPSLQSGTKSGYIKTQDMDPAKAVPSGSVSGCPGGKLVAIASCFAITLQIW
ncbi:unnamed protein product [Penicillium pancosmium]